MLAEGIDVGGGCFVAEDFESVMEGSGKVRIAQPGVVGMGGDVLFLCITREDGGFFFEVVGSGLPWVSTC